MIDISLKINNYKCFGEGFQGFDGIYPINIIIGRNNSGKSSLLDLVKYIILPYDLNPLAHKNSKPQVILESIISDEIIRNAVAPGTYGGNITGNHLAFIQEKCLGKKISVELHRNGTRTLHSLDCSFGINIDCYENTFVQKIESPFKDRTFKHLKAERIVNPEGDSATMVNENGAGATSIIQQFINKAALPSNLVEDTVLQELNKIMQPDSTFTDIVVQQIDGGVWEIYLEEKSKGRIALSQSGSGLQTILLVLVFLYLVPAKEKKPLDNYVFAFEELENNLHPALLRRLFLYIRDIALKQDTYFFITTHSSVVIDLFSNDPEAQLIHTTHNGKTATVNRVKAYVERKEILDDLDVRASDLLQSNGIVWVEGPSDRLYFNRWIEIWSNGKLREGAHYQCVFYGGRLQAHLTARIDEEERNKLIKILLVNRNAIFLNDSDRQYARQRLNTTKQRIRQEINDIGAVFWETKGKEIENYISHSAIASLFEKKINKQIEQYQSFSDYLDKIIRKGEGKKFLSNKVLFAEKICPHLCRENLSSILDLEERLDEVCKRIKKWNAM